jgi:lipid-A-disaccharide synthase-like uncharacterized protein
MFGVSFLFASLLWGSVGLGYFIYGKKQQSVSPMVGGILMMIVSYFIASALLMSLAYQPLKIQRCLFSGSDNLAGWFPA